MKKLHTILCIAIASIFITQLQAQSPGLNYQVTVRDDQGELVETKSVRFRTHIKQGSDSSSPIYSEQHLKATDKLGNIKFNIGEGTPIPIDPIDESSITFFTDIDWSLNNYYLFMEVSIQDDQSNYSTYVATPETEFSYVPYALYAEKSGNSITTEQANEIEANTAKVSMVLGTDPDTALAGNTTTITTEQADAIVANTAKVSMVLGTDADTALAGDTPLYTQAEVDLLIANIESRMDNAGIPGLVTDNEGNSYEYITYGDQAWTLENAEVEKYNDGTEILKVTSANEWTTLTKGAWCYIDGNPAKGKLYNWYAVMGIHNDTSLTNPLERKEFAPEGWHVPTDAEWTELENYLILADYNYDGSPTLNKIAKPMASKTGWDTSTDTRAVGNNQSINNSSGFNAFPEGNRGSSTGTFHFEGEYAFFWSSNQDDGNTDYARNRYLKYNKSELKRSSFDKKNGFSVRFVRD